MQRLTIEVSGVWLRSYQNRMQVLIEKDGKWYVVIDTYAPLDEMSVSHIVEPRGMMQVIAHSVPDV